MYKDLVVNSLSYVVRDRNCDHPSRVFIDMSVYLSSYFLLKLRQHPPPIVPSEVSLPLTSKTSYPSSRGPSFFLLPLSYNFLGLHIFSCSMSPLVIIKS